MCDEGVTIINALAQVLERLIDVNDKCQLVQSAITKFQSIFPPEVSILAYLERIHKYARCSDSCFVIALIYMDRLIEMRNIVLSKLNVHRILITSVLLSAKFIDDLFYNNAFYAKLGGITTLEMNLLELEFLQFVGFTLSVSPDVFDKYRNELRNYPQPVLTYIPIPIQDFPLNSVPSPSLQHSYCHPFVANHQSHRVAPSLHCFSHPQIAAYGHIQEQQYHYEKQQYHQQHWYQHHQQAYLLDHQYHHQQQQQQQQHYQLQLAYDPCIGVTGSDSTDLLLAQRGLKGPRGDKPVNMVTPPAPPCPHPSVACPPLYHCPVVSPLGDGPPEQDHWQV